MKKEYNSPIIEIENLQIEDIITASGTVQFDKNGFDLEHPDGNLFND